MYKYLDKKRIFQIKKIEKQFFHISKITSIKDNNYNWWLHEISRLDFRPWGGLNTKNFLENKPLNSIFIRRFMKDLINIIFFVLRGFFLKPRKFSYKNIFISEKIIFTKKIKNFYFNGIYNNVKSKSKIIASISKVNDKNVIDLNSLVGFNDKLKILFKSLSSEIKLFFFLRKLVKQKKIDKFWIDYFYIKESLKNIYINLIVYKFFVNNNFCKNIIFPYEEKTLERSIMLALNNKNKNKKTKSFALCINPQHNLSSFLKKFDGLDIPRTDKYLYCGKLYRNYFTKLGRLNILSTNKKDCIGSLKSRITNIKLNKNRNFLVLLSHINEYYELARYMKKEKKLLDYDFILRPYPHSEDEVKICKHIQKNNLKNFKISKKSLKKDIKKCFAVIFSGTSAGIEAVNHGRVGIWSNLSNVGINPLFNNVENFLPNSNASQFRKKIEFLNKMKISEIKKLLKIQQNFCQKIYSRININIINYYFN